MITCDVRGEVVDYSTRSRIDDRVRVLFVVLFASFSGGAALTAAFVIWTKWAFLWPSKASYTSVSSSKSFVAPLI